MQIRKLATSLIGALLAGATLAAPALGQSLEDLPAPFVEDGSTDFVVVVGADANPADIVGAVDIAARFGGEPVSTQPVAVNGPAYEVDSVMDDFNYDEDFGNHITFLYQTLFPELVTTLTYAESEGLTDNTARYTQKLSNVGAGGGELVFEADDESTRGGVTDVLGTYLKLRDTTAAYTYTLAFDTPVEFDNTSAATTKNDFENSKLTMLASSYTISDVEQSGGAVTKIELLGGAVESTAQDGEDATLTFGGVEYTVTPNILSDTEVAFTVEWDGNTYSTSGMDDGDTEELSNGVEIGVDEIFYSSKDTKTSSVNFRLGAKKLLLEDGQEVEIDDEDVDGSSVTLTTSDSELREIQVTYTTEDDVYLAPGEEWVDPVFGTFKYMFLGIDDQTRLPIKMSTSGNTGTLSFSDIENNPHRIDVVENSAETQVYWGDSLAPNGVIQGGETFADAGSSGGNLLIEDGDSCFFEDSSGVTDIDTACEDIELLVSSQEGELRVWEINSIDTSANTISFRDKTNGGERDTRTYTADATTTVDLGYASISFIVNETAVDFDGDSSADDRGIQFTNINTFLAAGQFTNLLTGRMELDSNATSTFVRLMDADDQDTLFNWDIGVDSDGDIIMENITGHSDGLVDASDADDNTQGLLDGATVEGAPWGAVLWYDSENKNDIDVIYPTNQEKASVYVALAGTTATGGTSRTGQVDIPVSKLDVDVDEPGTESNLVLVGGPCANRLVAQLADAGDYPWTCDEAVELGGSGYSIELINDAFADGQAALVVAGQNAADTRDAAVAVQQFEALSGRSVRTGAFSS